MIAILITILPYFVLLEIALFLLYLQGGNSGVGRVCRHAAHSLHWCKCQCRCCFTLECGFELNWWLSLFTFHRGLLPSMISACPLHRFQSMTWLLSALCCVEFEVDDLIRLFDAVLSAAVSLLAIPSSVSLWSLRICRWHFWLEFFSGFNRSKSFCRSNNKTWMEL